MKLKNMFAGKRMRCRKIKRETLIDGLAMMIQKPAKRGMAGLWSFSEKGPEKAWNGVPRNADHTHATATPWGRDSCDGIAGGMNHRE